MKYFLLGLLFLASQMLTAQNVGVNTTTPEPSAILDVNSNQKGFLPPRMTTAERNAISAPALGLMIYNTSSNCLEVFTGSTWSKLCKDGCVPMPTIPNAGADFLVNNTNVITLNANIPSVGVGSWQVISGTGTSFSNINSPTSTFTAPWGQNIQLKWVVSNSCDTLEDDLSVIFNCSSPNLANCNGLGIDGCEIDLSSSIANCGSCGNACGSLPNAISGCTAGTCAIIACNAGFADCDGNPLNGCEVNLSTSIANCGTCGNTCGSLPNAISGCAAGACVIFACNTGFADCDGIAINGCEVHLNSSTTNCGACGNSCGPVANGISGCAGGTCVILSCNPGFANCDGNPSNGCEVNLNSSITNCGACGNSCGSLPNAISGCVGGSCVILSCNAGFANCDGINANGCEVNLKTSTTNCGACGNSCGSLNCVNGVCQ
jgi:hypothetical protein